MKYKSAALKFSYKIIPYILLSGCLISCKKDGIIGFDDNENTSGVSISDTFTVQSSTLLLDSLPTAGKGVLMVGYMHDPELGNIKASSYFKIAPPDVSGTLPTDAKLDSVRLKLNYSGYYYGDTTQIQTISIHQLKEKIVYKAIPGYLDPEEETVFSASSTFYNRSAFSYESAALGSLQFKAKPKSKDSLLIALPQSLGNTLFSMIRNKDSRVITSDDFTEYFKGLVLTNGGTGNAVIGYSDTAAIKLYYSYTGADGLKKKNEIHFGLYDNSYQFNSITTDRNGVLLNELTDKNKLVKASSTGYKTYIQAGIGLVTKLEFPSVAYLAGDKNISINKAELIIESPYGSEKPFAMPQSLVLLLANSNSKPTQIYTDSYSNTSALYLTPADDIDQIATYTFPLTEYINNYTTKYYNKPLLLSLPISSLQNSVNRLVVGAQGNSKAKIRLKITYTKNL